MLSTLSGDGGPSDVSKNMIASCHSGQNLVPRRCSNDSRHPPINTPSATPPLSQLQPVDLCRARGRFRSSFCAQSRNSSVHQVDGSRTPIGLASHSAFSMYLSVYSNILGWSAKSVSSAGPLKVTRPVIFQIAMLRTVMSENPRKTISSKMSIAPIDHIQCCLETTGSG